MMIKTESRTVRNPYLEKAQEYLEQYGDGDEEEKILRDKSTPRLKIKDKVEQRGNVLANVCIVFVFVLYLYLKIFIHGAFSGKP